MAASVAETNVKALQAEIAAAKHYWTVTLVGPPGASSGLATFIAMAEAAIQTAVDLLGRGTTRPPPEVEDLLTDQVYDSLGNGEAAENYEKTLVHVAARQTSLLTMDRKVLETSVQVAADQDQILSAIKRKVAELNDKLASVGKAKLNSAQEIALMRHIADTLDSVYEMVTEVAELNLERAGGSDKNDDSNSGSGRSSGFRGSVGGGGGGLQGLTSLLMPLAMIPMAAAPLVTEFLDNQREQDAESDKNKKPGEGSPPSSGNPPPPGDPAAPPPPGESAPPPSAAAPAPDTQASGPSTDPNVPQTGTPASNALPISTLTAGASRLTRARAFDTMTNQQVEDQQEEDLESLES